MRRILLAAAVVLLGLLTPSAHAATQSIGVADFTFRNGVCPEPTGTNIATVKVGDTVKWTNCDPNAHNITWKQDYELPNRTLQGSGTAGDNASVIFSRAGFYDYFCSIHGTPNGNSMQGRVVVESVQPSTTKATAPAPTTTMTTLPPTTTTTATTVDLDGVFATTTTLPEVTTTTTTPDELALESRDGGANGALVALLIAGIGAAVAGGVYLVRRMQTGI